MPPYEQESTNGRIAKYDLLKLKGWYTCLGTHQDGTVVASIVLPSKDVHSNSITWAEIGHQHGQITVREDISAFVRIYSIKEANRPDWRNAVSFNNRKLLQMSHKPGVMFGLETELYSWAKGVHCDVVRFFMGGDLCCHDAVVCMTRVADRIPNKRFFAVSSNIRLLNSIWLDAMANNISIPANMQLFTEYPSLSVENMYGFPLVKFEKDAGQDELSAYPANNKDNLVLRIPDENWTSFKTVKDPVEAIADFEHLMKKKEQETYGPFTDKTKDCH